jgi:hypothetical protein
MTLPPHGGAHHEVRRRIAGCRERLRKNRAAHHGESERAGARDAEAGERSAAPVGGDDEADGDAGNNAKKIGPALTGRLGLGRAAGRDRIMVAEGRREPE